MTLLIMVLRKIWKNGWMMGSLFTGLLISVALISSIPIYTDGVLHRMIVKELEAYQQKTNVYPSRYLARISFGSDRERRRFSDANTYMEKSLPKAMGIPYKAKAKGLSLDSMNMVEQNPAQRKKDRKTYARIQALSDLKEHITIADGRMAAANKVNGVYEAVIPEGALAKLDIVLNKPFVLEDTGEKGKGGSSLTVIPVGTFTVKDPNDLYWYYSPDAYVESFLIDYDLFMRDFVKSQPSRVKTGYWYYAFDYQAINVKNISSIIALQKNANQKMKEWVKNAYAETPSEPTLEKLTVEEKKLRTVLWALYVPIMIMLCFYLFMVSRLIVDRQKNEIAILRSRGASRGQIVMDYLMEGLLIGSVAFLTGPRVALLLGRVLGASNGFLELVNRASLRIELNSVAYLYGAVGICVAILTMLIPGYLAAGTTIIGYKRNISRNMERSVWEKFFFDILLLAIAIYGWYSFERRQTDLFATGVDASAMQVDPLLFFIPALCTLGGGLLFLRIYPWFLRMFYQVGKRIWTPPVYAILIQVGRSSKQYQFIMLFLMVSIATGFFGANAARTINQNAEEKISYMAGADVALTTYWENDAPEPALSSAAPAGGEEQGDGVPKKIQYKEPPFTMFQKLAGVEKAARVFQKDKGIIEAGGRNYSDIHIMGIDPFDFSKVCWFRDGLLPYHINAYLNLLIQEPSAILISKSFSEEAGLKVGDYLQMGWDNSNKAGFTVYGIIDYWPGWNPNRDPKSLPDEVPLLVVGNLDYIQDYIGIEPYEVWMKLKDNATSEALYASIDKSNIAIRQIKDVRQELIQTKNAPYQLAVNGGLTLGFVISMAICFIGFLLYWILSLGSRTLQFGILRAMGISRWQLLTMIAIEQLLTSGAAIFMGIMLGGITSRLYVPFFQITSNAVEQVPPFHVISKAADLIKIYGWVVCMLVLGLGILGYMSSHIKIDQAVKLGED